MFSQLGDYKDSKERASKCVAIAVELDRKEKERLAREQAEREQKKRQLEDRRNAITNELTHLKGLFTGKRRKELEAQLELVNNELRMI